jgi:anti-sigma B factor antagonist
VRLDERRIGPVAVLDLHGRVAIQDGTTVLREALERLVQQDCLRIVLNFDDTPYIDSTALGELIRAYTTLKRKGGALKLLNLTRPIHDLLQVTNLLSIFDTYDSEKAAVASFGKPE